MTSKLNEVTQNESAAAFALKSQLTFIEDTRAKIAPLQAKLNAINGAESALSNAKASLAAANAKRDDMLGRQYLGEAVDVKVIELEIKEAAELLEKLTADNAGASAAKSILEGQLNALYALTTKLEAEVLPLRYAALRELLTPMAEKYIILTEQTKTAYLELIGSAQKIDDFGANPFDGRPYLAASFNSAIDFPAMNIDEFIGFKSHHELAYEQMPFKRKFEEHAKEAGLL